MITVVNASFFGDERHIERIVDQPQYEGVEYILYTNKPERAEGTIWEVRDTKLENIGPRLAARSVKSNIHSYHPDSDYWLWIDASMKIQVDPNYLVEKYLEKFSICAMPHPERNNWVEEAKAVLSFGMDDSETLSRAVNKYLAEGCAPTQLWETGCLLRKNTPEVIKFNEIWWNEIQENSIRDQVSIQYASWKSGVHVSSFPGTNSRNPLRYEKKDYLPQWNEIIRAWN